MKERSHSVYTERKNRARKRREEERRKKEEGENQERVDVRKIMLLINQSRNYKEKLLCFIY
jgi:hypothetical protein